jgi:hypothetical protein
MALSALEDEGFDADEIYLAHTDADSRVPADWIARHLGQANQGWSAVLGPVRVEDWTPRIAATAARYALHCASEPAGQRVHGANLGVRADAYRRAGGFRALEVAEDRALIAHLRALGEPVVFAEDLPVSTSARVSRRVRGGFSDFLALLERRAELPAATP